MSKGLLASVAIVLAGASAALAQGPVLGTAGPVPATTTTAPVSLQQPIATAPAAPMYGAPAAPMYGAPPGEGYSVEGSGGCFNNCNACDCDRVWARAEYLLWWTKGSPTSTPLATSVAPGTPGGGTPGPGAIGGAGTSVAIGGGDVDLGTRQGVKGTIGFWFDREHTVGMEGTYFYLGTVSESETASTLGGAAAPTLQTPFFDVTGASTGGTPGPSAMLPALATIFAVPGGLSNNLITHDSMSLVSRLQGADGYGLFNVNRCNGFRVDAMFGFRWLSLGEDLDYTSNNQTNNQAQSHVIYNTTDTFSSSNNFYGALLGIRFESSPDDGHCGWRGGFYYRGDFKVALGDTVERTNIDGSTQTNLGNPLLGSPVTYAGGAFTQLSNLGGHDSDHFAVMPEVDLTLGYAFNTWGRVFVGYDFLYISDVARPGNQIDGGANLFRTALVQQANPPIAAPATDPSRPSFNAAQSAFWAQGLNLGMEVRF
ncbi:MAG TPA: BBP7 family outer membrane beta-barrel protein [Planctomycetaceae bacterium]|nr:BBP7 family outer membrane beta-barrel protein [Planctomycetaceae bacterium]